MILNNITNHSYDLFSHKQVGREKVEIEEEEEEMVQVSAVSRAGQYKSTTCA